MAIIYKNTYSKKKGGYLQGSGKNVTVTKTKVSSGGSSGVSSSGKVTGLNLDRKGSCWTDPLTGKGYTTDMKVGGND